MSVIQDVRFAVRGLKKAPGFTVVALVTLTLGIGANTAIFSAVYTTLMRPLAYRDAERIVFLWSSRTTVPREPLSPARLIDFRQQLSSFDAVAGISQIPLNLTGSGEPERLAGLPQEKMFGHGWSRDGRLFAFVRGVQIRDVVLIRELN